MLTRRNFLVGAVATGVLARSRSSFAKASQPATAVNFDIPPHACDCHTHFFGDPEKFALPPRHVYTPEATLPEEMSALHRALHIERVVIVTPAVYGADNSATLYGMKVRGRNTRGVAVIDSKTPESDLDAMDRVGVRGIRVISGASGPTDPAVARQVFEAAAKRLKSRNWHIQMYTSLAVISAMKDLVQSSPVPVVFDHFGGAQAALGLEQPGFADLLDLVRSGKAYAKISGAYRASKQGPDYPDVAPFAQALVAANAGRILWGTDWPHPDSSPVAGRKPTDLMPEYQIDDGRLLNQLTVWVPDLAIRKKILVDNPARLYGFQGAEP
jgi:predicted TIM-barrel fold metal-dependent hydrolase